MSKVTLALVISLMIDFGLAYSQEIRTSQGIQQVKRSYLKSSIFPSLFATLFRPYLWLTLDYEAQFKSDSRFTYNLVLDYRNLTTKVTLNGATVSSVSDNIDFYVRPQIRYYTGKTPYNGYYLGAFPLYLYRDKPSGNIKGNYWGAGLVTGYQIFISRKYPMEFYAWAAWQTGKIWTIDYNTSQSIQVSDSFVFINVQLNIGLPIKGRAYEKK